MKINYLCIRFEEEQRRLKERENVKLRQAEAMREVLEAAERLAKEQKKSRNSHRKRDEAYEENSITLSRSCESNMSNINQIDKKCVNNGLEQTVAFNNDPQGIKHETEKLNEKGDTNDKETVKVLEKLDQDSDVKSVQVPISTDVAIVLSGRLEDSELLNKANLQLVNLVLTPTPRRFDNNINNLSVGLNSLMQNSGSPHLPSGSSRIPSTIIENRLLTPSKYRVSNGRDFGTQTNLENDLQDYREKLQELTIKEVSMKDHKDATNASKRDNEK